MRRSLWSLVLSFWLGLSLIAEASPDDAPVAATVESNLSTAGKQIRQFAFDGSEATYFVSAENPGEPGQFTLTFDRPVPVRSVVAITGRPDATDLLENGSLEVSGDGLLFESVAKFAQDGLARIDLKQRPVRAIRIKPDPATAHPLVIREIKVDSAEPLATFAYPIEFAVDVADAPELQAWADKVARLCERWYHRLNEELKSDGFRPPTQISMTLKSTYKGVAQASGTRITGSVDFFKEHPDDLGAMIHETCHVIQSYRGRGNPGWLVEGIADHVRFFVYEPGKAGPVNPRRAHYDGSYRTTATFLDFVSRKYDSQLVLKLNQRLRERKYTPETFKDLTGKTLPELDAEWLASLAK